MTILKPKRGMSQSSYLLAKGSKDQALFLNRRTPFLPTFWKKKVSLTCILFSRMGKAVFFKKTF